ILTISNWDKSNSKSKVLDVIESGAKNQNIQIIKSVKDFDNKKRIFLFSTQNEIILTLYVIKHHF
ncbi:hypothetical protein LHK28_13595, partial [Staphylococcus argenteus]|nr:hypothetical protein [Staphylococcus argenteus]MCG9837488.1 hypothetical protein [Staphylococcus argenteus]MCG9844013.1 hypothetical protein [Staphylococcus argenteus]MCG9848621.1 hypothetical protein [Staphylococcus argenteus]MCG9851008.1 hypothetical protein [Staphylococcus argenteus]